MIRLALLFCILVLSPVELSAQYREIPLPFPDTTRFKVQFIDEMHGWVTSYRGSILQTTDGGANWVEHYFWQDPHMRDIEFVDERHGWITARTCSNTFVCFPEKLYRTMDGGATWDLRPFPDSTTIISRGYFPGYIYEPSNIDFLDSNSYVFQGYRYLISPTGFFEVAESWYSTTNSGTKWDSIPVPKHMNFGVLHFAKTLTDWMVVLYQGMPDFPNAVICGLTFDGGISWRTTKTWSDVTLINSWKTDSRRIVLFNCKQRLSSGLHPGTFVTTDGGETWSTYPYYSVAKMGIMPQDTTLWVIDLGDLCSSSAPETVDGYLYRTHPYVGEAYPRGRLMYPGRVRWVANAGEKVYVLTTDGRLIVFDDLVVSVRADPENSHPALIVHSIYPNPAENHVNILYSAAPLETVTIYLHDMLGRIVMKNELGETDGLERNNRTIDVGYLSVGIYRLTIFTKTSCASSLLVKH